MGSYTDDVIDGLFCNVCGDLIDTRAPGYPRQCPNCYPEQDDDNETS